MNWWFWGVITVAVVVVVAMLVVDHRRQKQARELISYRPKIYVFAGSPMDADLALREYGMTRHNRDAVVVNGETLLRGRIFNRGDILYIRSMFWQKPNDYLLDMLMEIDVTLARSHMRTLPEITWGRAEAYFVQERVRK